MSHDQQAFANLVRERGFRLTPQRQTILDAICEGGGHSTPEEIYARVHAISPAVNRATVYRNLDFLCEMRLVVATKIGRQMVYEIAREQPHHHLVCRNCGAEYELDHNAVKGLFARIEREQDFKVDMDHLALFGLCHLCRQKKPAVR